MALSALVRFNLAKADVSKPLEAAFFKILSLSAWIDFFAARDKPVVTLSPSVSSAAELIAAVY